MVPVQVHLVLNHVPLVGLVLGLIFFVAGIKRSSDSALLTGMRIFLAMGLIAVPVLASGLLSARVLNGAPWLDSRAVGRHQLAGILTVMVLVVLAALCGIILFRSFQGRGSGSVGVRSVVLLIAATGLGMVLWTSWLGGALRHSELTSGRQQSPPRMETRAIPHRWAQRSIFIGFQPTDEQRLGCEP